MGTLNNIWKDIKDIGQDLIDINVDAVNFLYNPFGITENLLDASFTWLKHQLIPDMRRDREAQIQTSDAARRIIYGRTRVAGSVVYAESVGDADANIDIIVVFTGHEIDGFEELWFNDQLVATAAGGWAIQEPFTSYAAIELHDGTQTAASPQMLSRTHGGWTADHKLLGCSYAWITMYYDEARYAAGCPTVKVVIRGKKVLDPRTGIIAWSDNPALCARDYCLTDVDSGGMGCDPDEINEAAFTAAADICDQMVESMIGLDAVGVPATPGVKTVAKPVIGSYEKRYTLNGQIMLDGAPTEVLKSMLSAMAGEAIYSEGAWKIFAGAPASSVTTINESWLNGGISFQTGPNKNEKNNTVKGKFTNSNDYWADTEFPEVPVGASTPPNASYWSVVSAPAKYNEAATYTGGQYCVWGSKVYIATTSVPVDSAPPNGSYWALIEMHDNSVQYPSGHTVQRGGTVYISTGIVPVSNAYLAEDGGEVLAANIVLPFTTGSSEAQRLAKIMLEKSRRGFTLSYPCNHRAFRLEIMDVVTVTNNLMGINGLFRVIGWDFSMMGGTNLTLIEYDANIYNWTPGDSTPLVSPVITNLPNPWTVAIPGNVTASAEQYVGVMSSDIKSQATITWEEAQPGAVYEILLDGTIIQTVNDLTYTVKDLTVGSHSIAVRSRNSMGAVSAWQTTIFTVAPVVDPTESIRFLNNNISETKAAKYLSGQLGFMDLIETGNGFVAPGFFTEGTLANLPDQIRQVSGNLLVLAEAIQFKATKAELSAELILLSDLIGLSLDSPAVGWRPGMTITWLDAGHTQSVIDFMTNYLRIGSPDDDLEYQPLVTVASVGGVPTLTLNGTLAVNTINLADNAVTVPEHYYTDETVRSSGATLEVQQGNIITTGFPLLVMLSFNYHPDSGTQFYVRIDRFTNGVTTTIYTGTAIAVPASLSQNFSCQIKDTPAAGTHTYTAYMVCDAGFGAKASQRSLVLLGVKK